MSKRMAIPSTLAAKVLFEAHRTCCVCRQKGKPVQIHHIDSNHSNSAYENLAVLCLDCHTDTQIRGGFHRKLDADQIVLYVADWKTIVSRGRAQQRALDTTIDSKSDVGRLVSQIESLKSQRDYEGLIFTFDNLGQTDLRDKYIELHLKRDTSFEAQFYFRGLQNRIDLLDQVELEKHFTDLELAESWQDLSSAYFRVGDNISGVKFLCKHIARAIEDGNYFNAAYCFRSLHLNASPEELFEKSLDESKQKGDLFWELRALQELEWTDELQAALKANEDEIKKNPLSFDMFSEDIDDAS